MRHVIVGCTSYVLMSWPPGIGTWRPLGCSVICGCSRACRHLCRHVVQDTVDHAERLTCPKVVDAVACGPPDRPEGCEGCDTMLTCGHRQPLVMVWYARSTAHVLRHAFCIRDRVRREALASVRPSRMSRRMEANTRRSAIRWRDSARASTFPATSTCSNIRQSLPFCCIDAVRLGAVRTPGCGIDTCRSRHPERVLPCYARTLRA